MRKKNVSSSYILLGIFLFFWVSFPKSAAERLRSFTVASLSPAWTLGKQVQGYLSDRPSFIWTQKSEAGKEELQRLQIENQTLRMQVEMISRWLVSEQKLTQQIELLQGLKRAEEKTADLHMREFFKRRSTHLRDLLQREAMAMPAQPIYRDPSSWSSCLWVNVGEEDNRVLGRSIIAKNSPVVAGNALVGVIDYVGNTQSRVRLITDSGLSPAVRAVRGSSQEREVASLASALLERIQERKEMGALTELLEGLKKRFNLAGEEMYLAKGELQGSSTPFWRSRSSTLKGFGFNFDYEDEESCLRKAGPLIQEGDLLVTSGLDGVFPPDLLVGRVCFVSPMKPGDYAYEIQASPAAWELNHFTTLFVLPPRSVD